MRGLRAISASSKRSPRLSLRRGFCPSSRCRASLSPRAKRTAPGAEVTRAAPDARIFLAPTKSAATQLAAIDTGERLLRFPIGLMDRSTLLVLRGSTATTIFPGSRTSQTTARYQLTPMHLRSASPIRQASRALAQQRNFHPGRQRSWMLTGLSATKRKMRSSQGCLVAMPRNRLTGSVAGRERAEQCEAFTRPPRPSWHARSPPPSPASLYDARQTPTAH
jgi:hypothetical protein